MVPASIPPKVAFERVHPKYTLPPYSPPLDEHVVGQALKLMSASCQFLINSTLKPIYFLVIHSMNSLA